MNIMFFFTTIALWALILFFVRPQLFYLQKKIPSYWKSFKDIQVIFWLGMFLIITFFILSDGTFDTLNQNWLMLFGLNNLNLFTPWWFVQTVTHNFIHLNLHHLLSNLFILALLSMYQRRVKPTRFLAVFLSSGILSSPSVFFVCNPLVTVGASAGLLGLVAAYLLDDPNLPPTKYHSRFIMILMLFLLCYTTGGKSGEINTLGDLFGLLFGALIGVFCRDTTLTNKIE